MPRNARVVQPDVPYHITQRGTNRERVFFTLADRHLYLRLIRESLDSAGARVLAYCLMNNHIHFVLIPEREDSLAVLFARANGRYAQALNIRRGRSGHLWQARFHSCPLSDQHTWTAVRYVEQNPCRAGLAASPQDYRWSSAWAHLTGQRDRSGILDLGFWADSGGANFWREMHQVSPEPGELLGIRKCTYAGRPFGDEAFIAAMEDRFGRKWRRPGPKSSSDVGGTAQAVPLTTGLVGAGAGGGLA